MQSFVFWRWPHSSTFLTLTENAFVKFLGSGDWCKVEFLLITVMSPKLPQSSRSAQLRDVRKSLAAKNEEGIRPNKQRQPANLPLIQQLQARKAFSLSANLVTKKKREENHKRLFLKCNANKEGKVDRMLPALHESHSVRREEGFWYITGHFNLVPSSETLRTSSHQLQGGTSIPPRGQGKVQPPRNDTGSWTWHMILNK